MTGPTVAHCLQKAAGALAAAGIASADRDARLLLAHALDEEPSRLIAYPERIVDGAPAFEALVARRVRREPMAQILGRREFWGLTFRVTPDTLDPRPDSETLIEAALERIVDRGAALRIADLGTGTGCLLLALLSELPAATGAGVDLSTPALKVFRENAATLGLDGRALGIRADWGSALAGPFDLIVSNPPYIATGTVDGLQPEVSQHEPRLALDGGPDGLAAYRVLVRRLSGMLAPEGFAVIELGEGQAGPVASLCIKHGLTAAGYRRDLAGRTRCLIATRDGP